MSFARLKLLVSLCRPDYAIKQVFFFIGTAFSILVVNSNGFNLFDYVAIFISSMLASSANYVLNEWCDRDSDRYHPVKRFRPIPSGQVSKKSVITLYCALIFSSFIVLALTQAVYIEKLLVLLIIINGIAYNKKPLRLKDKPYIDTLIESLNNLFRFLLGWILFSSSLPPASLATAIWLIGYFLMTCKRISEINLLDQPNNSFSLEKYRKSLSSSTKNGHTLMAYSLSMLSVMFLSIFSLIYNIELIVFGPLLVFVMARYLKLSLDGSSSSSYKPADLVKDKYFLAAVPIAIMLLLIVNYMDLTILREITGKVFYI